MLINWLLYFASAADHIGLCARVLILFALVPEHTRCAEVPLRRENMLGILSHNRQVQLARD